MFGKKQNQREPRDLREAEERFARNEQVGKNISSEIAKLKSVPRGELPDAVFVLFMAAKQQNERIRAEVKAQLAHEAEYGGTRQHDLATFQAEEVAQSLREHSIPSQTFVERLAEQLSEARFAVPGRDAVSMIAAMLREQRLEGILEGLRLAGLLNEAPNRRNDSAAMNELRKDRA